MKHGNGVCSDSIHSKERFFDENSTSGFSGFICRPPQPRPRCLRTLLIATFSTLAVASFLLFSSSSFDRLSPVIAQEQVKSITYELVPGFSAQSLTSTNDATFEFVWTPLPHSD